MMHGKESMQDYMINEGSTWMTIIGPHYQSWNDSVTWLESSP